MASTETTIHRDWRGLPDQDSLDPLGLPGLDLQDLLGLLDLLLASTVPTIQHLQSLGNLLGPPCHRCLRDLLVPAEAIPTGQSQPLDKCQDPRCPKDLSLPLACRAKNP